MAVPARQLEPAPRRRAAPRRRSVRPVPRSAHPARRAPARRAPSRRSRRFPFLVLSLLVTAAMVVALASAQAMVAQGSFRMAELSDQAQALEAEYDRLRFAAARLSSPERVTRAAREAGLVLPTEVELLAVGGTTPRPPALPEATFALKDEPGGAG